MSSSVFFCVFLITTILFSIKTAEEINEKMNGLMAEEPRYFRNGSSEELRDMSTPRRVDWREEGLVSPVQNQVSDTFPTEEFRIIPRLTGGCERFPRACAGPAGPSALWGLWRAR